MADQFNTQRVVRIIKIRIAKHPESQVNRQWRINAESDLIYLAVIFGFRYGRLIIGLGAFVGETLGRLGSGGLFKGGRADTALLDLDLD